ncbi:MAG: putative metal-binding motif-containing protein, partial [Myxococcales bacterium]|nr:putative metal-binding motif-containing protein [Myxococcales bacterium]
MRLTVLAPLVALACKGDTGIAPAPNVAPVVSILAPTDGATAVEGETVELIGLVGDGNGLDDIVSVSWASSIDGVFDPITLGQNGRAVAAVQLSAGSHTVSLTAGDSAGLTDVAAISLVVEQADRVPAAEILTPTSLQAFVVGQPIALEGVVADPNEPASNLGVRWEARQQGSTTLLPIDEGAPSNVGLTTAVWSDPPSAGSWIVRLTVTDSDGLSDDAEVPIVLADSLDADQDGDHWTPAQGDCDDLDATRNPGAPELCGNDVDDDCSGVVDDRDDDNDLHVDVACASTYPGSLPADDCDDTNASVHPGAPEGLDGTDDDCDGDIDEGT